MTKAEQVALIIQNQKRFYAWEPPEVFNPFQVFKCWHVQPYPQMSEQKCKARALKPELYSDCSNKCPRWKHYRELAKKPIRIAYE
jgi:hypothetical protein